MAESDNQKANTMPTTTTPPRETAARPQRTPDEQKLLDWMAEDEGQDWVDRHAELILAQARQVGDL